MSTETNNAATCSLARLGMRQTVDRTRTAQDEARWVDAWHLAYKWRADHWGKMPEQKHRRMMRAREREDIAWKREREAVERTKAHTDQALPQGGAKKGNDEH